MHTPFHNPNLVLKNHAKAIALGIGGAIVILWALAALYLSAQVAPTANQEGGKDLQVYRRIVARVHGGESYYSAAANELRAGGYSTNSVFNWRLPTYAWLLALFPQPEWGQALLGLLALAAMALAYGFDRQQASNARSAVLLLLMAGAFLWCIDGDAYFSQELWAGVLIALSVGALAVGQRSWGVATGVAALLMRELAIPYVLVAMVLAGRDRRWREAGLWCGGLAIFAAFFAWHAGQVDRHLTDLDRVEAAGWIQFGGPAFVIRTCQMNVWLLRLPAWVALLYVAASLLGVAYWRGPIAALVAGTVGAYLVAFLVVGKPTNSYWGLLYVALLPFGVIRVPQALQALFGTPLLPIRHPPIPASEPAERPDVCMPR